MEFTESVGLPPLRVQGSIVGKSQRYVRSCRGVQASGERERERERGRTLVVNVVCAA